MKFADLVEEELRRARDLHPTPHHSYHEGFAILLEEVDELKAEVWKRSRRASDILTELVHVAAMAARFAEDLDLV